MKDNSQMASIYNSFKFDEREWKDIKGADFIKINKEESIPADFVVILTSAASGIAYVETSSLDGEKNLKPKFASPVLMKGYLLYKFSRLIIIVLFYYYLCTIILFNIGMKVTSLE